MKRIKLLFGSALALVLALSLFVPTNVSAEETGTTPDTVTPTAIGDVLDQSAFDLAYPAGVKAGTIIDLSDYYTGDVLELIINDVVGDGGIYWYEDDVTYKLTDTKIWVYGEGDIEIEFYDEDGNPYYLEFVVTENPVDIVLNPEEVTIEPGETTTILIETVPEDAWWFWEVLADQGSSGVSITTTISDITVISVDKAYDENGDWIGYTVKGLAEGTATISIESELGHISVATVTVKKPAPAPTTPPANNGTTPSTKPAVAANNGGPATGDTTNTTMYMLMMLAALASVSGYTFLKKQK